MPGVEIRSFGSEEENWTGQIHRLAQAPYWDAGEKAGAHALGPLVIGIHPLGQWRTEDRWPQRVDGDACRSQFAAERLGDAVDGGRFQRSAQIGHPG